jgi:uncharacterized protein
VPVVCPEGNAYLAAMRAYLWFLAVIGGTLLLAALASYPLFLLVHPLAPTLRFDKIATRLWQLLMLLTLLLVVRRLRLRSARDFGYGAPRPRWLRQFGRGLALGVASMVPVTVSLLALGVLVPRADLGPVTLGGVLLGGALSGLAVGFVEETFFRGLMQGAVVRELQMPLAAIVLVALVYASVHFLAGTHIPADAVRWSSGLDLLHAALRNFAHPAGIVDAWLALLCVGVLLGLAAWWTGNIALGVGLHAGWVFVMRATVGATSADPGASRHWLVNADNGFLGWLVLGWTLLLLAVVVAMRDRFRGWRPGY